MSNVYPAPMGGAPGRSQAPGQSGRLAPNAQEIACAKAFGNAGAREGGPSPMPASARDGACSPDESCRNYSGNPRDNGAR